jgi:preprotein translocase subunit SecD
VIYQGLSIAFAVVAVASLAGAWLKRGKRATYIWALFSAAVAAGSAAYHVFWPVAIFGLMAFWALFTSMQVMTLQWRVKVGMSWALVFGAILSIYPTVHDEAICSESKDKTLTAEQRVAALPETCPQRVRLLDVELREKHVQEAALGNKGFKNFLLANIPYRMVRGLDLKGGLRLVYTVDVAEAIKDRRDRYYDDLRSALTKSYGFAVDEQGQPIEGQPSVEHMQKLGGVLKITKPRERVDSIVITFEDAADSQKHIHEEFLTGFIGELAILRSADGKEVSFTVRNEVESFIRERAVTQAQETILKRIDSMGVKEAAVSVRDEDVIVEIPGRGEEDFKQIRDIISQTARLEFKMVDDEVNFFEKIAGSSDSEGLPKGLRFEIENAPIGPGKTQPNYYSRLTALQGESMQDALERFKAWSRTLQIDQDHEIGFGKVYEINEDTEDYEQVGWRSFYLWAKAEITGDMVRDAQARADQNDAGMGGWSVNMQLTQKGGEIFEQITGDNVKRRFAIILDEKVESAPVIQDKIGGGNARITMGAGGIQQQLEDARKLELVLRSGALPAPISPSNEQIIGALLGEDAINDGVRAAGIGSLLVLVLMIVSYRRAGFIANVAVMFNLVLQIMVLSMFSASMTLPGIAGLALTIGVAVDANVLINERIKEELAAGKSARAAVVTGYDKAFSAIIDGHATTLISGLILAQYGTGPIKGFAVTLIIGMLTSLFTGVVVTRLFFEFWVRGRRKTELSIG